MAPSTIETSVIDFSSFGGGGFPLAPTGGSVVVEGLDLDRGVNGRPNGNVGLLRMGAHRRPATYSTKLRRVMKGSGLRSCVVVPALGIGGRPGLLGDYWEQVGMTKQNSKAAVNQKRLAMNACGDAMRRNRGRDHPSVFTLRWNHSSSAFSNHPQGPKSFPSYIPFYRTQSVIPATSQPLEVWSIDGAHGVSYAPPGAWAASPLKENLYRFA